MRPGWMTATKVALAVVAWFCAASPSVSLGHEGGALAGASLFGQLPRRAPKTKTSVVTKPITVGTSRCGVPEYGPAPPCMPAGAVPLARLRVQARSSERVRISAFAHLVCHGEPGTHGAIRLRFTVDGRAYGQSPSQVVTAGMPSSAQFTRLRVLGRGSHVIEVTIAVVSNPEPISVGPVRLSVGPA